VFTNIFDPGPVFTNIFDPGLVFTNIFDPGPVFTNIFDPVNGLKLSLNLNQAQLWCSLK